MMRKGARWEQHRVSIAEEVVAQMAGMAASAVEGVSELQRNVADNLKAFLGEEGYPSGVIARVEDRTARLTLYVAVEYGYPIQEVARHLQRQVKDEIESMTGLSVTAVDVYVTDLTLPEGRWRLPESHPTAGEAPERGVLPSEEP